jgi:alpha/beta superfamily hydrolase
MNPRTERLQATGPAGRIEVQRDQPEGTPVGTALIAHPHPLFGGTMDNKVVQTLARAFVQCGWTALRFNFRGVGGSAGSYDEGRGEAQDFLALADALAPQGPLAVAGFSFGAFVAAQALQSLWSARDVRQIVLVGTAASRFQVPALPPDSHERALVIHGEADETVQLGSVLDWARPQSLPVTVVPGVEHFFHGQLPLLKNLVVRHLRTHG